MTDNQDQNLIATVDVCSKRNLDYTADCLSKFNMGAKYVKLCSLGGNAAKAMHVAQILCDTPELGIECHHLQMKKRMVHGILSNCLEITLKQIHVQENCSVEMELFEKNEITFIDFPLYHLLLDTMLHTKNSLRIFDAIRYSQPVPLIDIKKDNWEISCKTLLDINEREHDQYGGDPADKLASVYNRCGLLLSDDGVKVGKILSATDDVIIGLDTNIIYNTAITAQLLDFISIINTKHFVQLPNWVFFIIPSTVMTEIEHSCNMRNNKGWLTNFGRLGFRAMQEIQELEKSEDLMGISVAITGEANPLLDTGDELKKIRSELSKISRYYLKKNGTSKDSVLNDKKSSSGDMMIRDQFKQFLRQIDFHKNTYFLTADKSNAALARTEGIHSVLFRSANKFSLMEKNPQKWTQRNWKIIRPPTIECTQPDFDNSGLNMDISPITLSVPLGKLIYELAVDFEKIRIVWDGGAVTIKSDAAGRDLEYWLYKDLIMENKKEEEGWKILVQNYSEKGKFPLHIIRKLWIEMNGRDEQEFKENHVALKSLSKALISESIV